MIIFIQNHFTANYNNNEENQNNLVRVLNNNKYKQNM